MMNEVYSHFHPTVKDVEKNAERESGVQILGTDPKSGKPVSVRLGKFGPMAQIGDAEDENKQFASLNPNQNIGTISLEERSEEHTSELQSRPHLVCRLLLE